MLVEMHHAHVFWPGMFFLFALSRLFWLALLGFLVWAIARSFAHRNGSRPFAPWPMYTPGTPQTPPAQPGQPEQPEQPAQLSALEILRQRYARGEIDGETYEHMRERLEASQKPND